MPPAFCDTILLIPIIILKTFVPHYRQNGMLLQLTLLMLMPLLMVYAPINRYHILDLNPERSVVKKFVSAGFDVFLLDWGDRQSKNKPTLADYVDYID
jgi:poly(3-hydroxyalkanoate) synthetase